MKTVHVPEKFRHYYDNYHFSAAVDAGPIVYLSGCTASHPDKDMPDDPEAQFHDAFAKLGAYLAEAGLGFDDVVEITTYHVDLRKHAEVFAKVKDQYMGEPYPAWTAIGVTDFMHPRALVEIRAVAWRG
ncbi:RidA family protein [Pseudohalocynthiibacter aestuariivivens]|nr:RidA family protein [Pseudohalocynthiibacter aestuariivivens]QIE44995.1 RidA family protein [Pseudohalocynthiibacter aestuariivivens]